MQHLKKSGIFKDIAKTINNTRLHILRRFVYADDGVDYAHNRFAFGKDACDDC
jgi:hypothetical protein